MNKESQTCRFCENPESILTKETCCSGCSKIDDPYAKNDPFGSELKEMIKESIEEIFFSEDEYSPFNSLQDKINRLLDIHDYENRVDRAIPILEKYENYMKNIDRLNTMVNELKGQVAILRANAKRD